MNEVEARDRIREAVLPWLQDSGDSLERSLDEAADGLLAIWQVSEDVARSPGSVGAWLPFRYVIPDEDLKLVETAFSVLTTAAGVGYFMPHLGFDPTKGVVEAITAVVVAILRMLHNLRLSVRLTPEDYAIVALLAGARAKGLGADELGPVDNRACSFCCFLIQECKRGGFDEGRSFGPFR